MFVNGLGTANPPQRYSKAQCWEAFRTSDWFLKLDRRAHFIAETVLTTDNGIESRSLSVDSLSEVFHIDPDTLHARFLANAPALAAAAGESALKDAGLSPDEIGGVVISTCTGYLCPGLTSYVVERLGLSPNVLAFDLVGQGLSKNPHPQRRRIEWKEFASLVNPAERNALMFETRNGMLRNILTRPVPRLAAEHAERVLHSVLDSAGLKPTEISAWIMHAGGRDVLEALQRRLNLGASDLRYSADMLYRYGNMSSAFVYFVLQAALDDDAEPGWWWMSAFGAGFSCHGALLKAG